MSCLLIQNCLHRFFLGHIQSWLFPGGILLHGLGCSTDAWTKLHLLHCSWSFVFVPLRTRGPCGGRTVPLERIPQPWWAQGAGAPCAAVWQQSISNSCLALLSSTRKYANLTFEFTVLFSSWEMSLWASSWDLWEGSGHQWCMLHLWEHR